jgi:hypothetical protein
LFRHVFAALRAYINNFSIALFQGQWVTLDFNLLFVAFSALNNFCRQILLKFIIVTSVRMAIYLFYNAVIVWTT